MFFEGFCEGVFLEVFEHDVDLVLYSIISLLVCRQSRKNAIAGLYGHKLLLFDLTFGSLIL